MLRLFWGISVIGLFLTFFVGWILNIVALIGMDSTVNGLLIGRVIGIFIAPLGSILGLFV